MPCPRGWWGEKSCGPCNCDTSKGFDSDCNKTSGACRCKVTCDDHVAVVTLTDVFVSNCVCVCVQDNHFRPVGSDACLLCDCYSVGSFSRACDGVSGSCQCKPGVIGRQCDRCDNPFAEVSPNGCEGQILTHTCVMIVLCI